MQTLKVNFTIPEDVIGMLKAYVGERQRSSFVAAAIREKLIHLEREQLRQALIEGYLAQREEDLALNKEWESATLESWG